MNFAIGFAVGLAWGVGAVFTMGALCWTGPLWIPIVCWPALLVIDRVRRP